MKSLRKIKNFEILTNEELKSFFELIYPSKKLNLKLLLEIERRNILNDQKVLKYLLELKKLKIHIWYVERLLLCLYNFDHPSIKFIEPKYITEEIKSRKYFKLKKVIKSIRRKEISDDFINFIEILENLIFNLNFGNELVRNKVLLENKEFIYKFIDVIDHCKSKKKDFNLQKTGKFYFKETWILALNYKKVKEQILFLILINLTNLKDYHCQLLKNSLQEKLFKEGYKNLYYAILEINERKEEKIVVPNCELEIKPNVFTFNVNRANKTKDKKSLEWYKERTNNK